MRNLELKLRAGLLALDPTGFRPLKALAALSVAMATLLVVAFGEHAPYDIEAGLVARVVAGLVPLLSAALAGTAVLRPRLGLAVILLATPVVNVAQVSWTVGPVQVIAQTVFLLALGIGLLFRGAAPTGPDAPEAAAAAAPAEPADRPAAWRPWRRISLMAVAAGATASLLGLATLSTALSPQVGMSATVLLHGILEPAAFALVFLALRPTRRFLVLILAVLAVSVAVGGILNMVQTLATVRSLSVLQAQRLLFSRITYFNVGLFGEMAAMAMPLLIGLLLARRRLHISRPVSVLLAVLAGAVLASLFLTFSKSAYLATVGGSVTVVLLAARGWRRRASIVVAAGLLSAVVIPWPAFFLQIEPPLGNAYRSAVVLVIGESRYDSWNPETLSGRGSLLERWYATRAAAHIAVDHPLLGIGLDQFQTEYVGRYHPAEARLALDSAHSMWAELAAELGFPALACVLLIYMAAMLALLRVERSPPDETSRLLAAILLAAMISWLIVATAFAGDMYRPWRNMASDYVMMMVLVAAAFALYRSATPPTDAAEPERLEADTPSK